jgi:hypothetical protein
LNANAALSALISPKTPFVEADWENKGSFGCPVCLKKFDIGLRRAIIDFLHWRDGVIESKHQVCSGSKIRWLRKYGSLKNMAFIQIISLEDCFSVPAKENRHKFKPTADPSGSAVSALTCIVPRMPKHDHSKTSAEKLLCLFKGVLNNNADTGYVIGFSISSAKDQSVVNNLRVYQCCECLIPYSFRP